MSFHGLTRFAAVALLLIAADGCRTLPPVPEHARGPADFEEGIPMERIFAGLEGESAPASEWAEAAAPPPSAESSPAEVVPAHYQVEEDEEEGIGLAAFAPSNVIGTLKEMAGRGPDEGVARQLYAEGEQLFAEKKYGEAARRFKAAAARWPDSTLEEDALFMAGESCFFADDYPEANDYYEKLLKKYEYSRRLDMVVARLFAIGRYWEQVYQAAPSWPVEPNLFDDTRPLFDTWGNAVRAYDVVRLYDPTGPLADDSIMATGNALFLRGRYEEAAYNYDLLRKEYPKSEHQVPAHMLAMKSKMAMYQGPMYDGAPLKDAGEIADQTLTQFRGELGDERDLVLRTKRRVIEERAARDWAVAQYYDSKKCYGSARIYYRSLIEEYPQTAVARQAESRLAEIQGLPAEPPDHFTWLSRIFPTHEQTGGPAFGGTTLFEWVSDPFRGPPRPSEEFRDEPTP